jgi:general secretion pathway protein E
VDLSSRSQILQNDVEDMVSDWTEVAETFDVMGLQELGLSTEQIVSGRYFRGKGCNHCMSSGFKGRVAAYEVLFVDEEVRQLIRRRAPVEQVQEAAQRNGMRTLLDAGTELVLQGLTTLEEVHRCIGAP